MKNILFTVLVLVFISGLSYAGSDRYQEGTVLVRFSDSGYGLDSMSPEVRAQARQQILDSAGGGTVVHLYKYIPWALVKLPSGQCVASMMPEYASTAGIMSVEPNYKFELHRTPNDAEFDLLWAMQNTGQAGGTAGADISATGAWDIETGDSDVIVAVIDSGVDYSHSDLQGNMWINMPEETGIANFDDDGNGYIDDYYGYDFAGDSAEEPDDGDSDPCDVFGHGTHVAGTIGAQGNNSIGVTGVCWNVSLMALKVGSDDSGIALITDAILEAIEYAIDKDADIINASWGFEANEVDGGILAVGDAIRSARDAGIIFVASAGNGGIDGIGDNIEDVPMTYPAAFGYENIITVMATTNTDEPTAYSNYGLTSVDIAAPGGVNTGPAGIRSCIAGGSYGYMSGTSMAAPHVSGACALLLSYNPDLTYTEVKDLLLSKSDKLPSLAGLCVSGGRLNVEEAVREIAIDVDAPSPNPAKWAYTGSTEWGKPKQTGVQSIAMEVEKAEDKGQIEYYFECINDSNLNSGWQSETRYERIGLDEGTEYTFRLRARDDSGNMTNWSNEESATTDIGTDASTPFSDPPQWNYSPQYIRFLTMSAAAAFDESGVEYIFDCIEDNSFDSGWQSSPFWRPAGTVSLDQTYTFRFKVRDGLNHETAWSDEESIFTGSGSTIYPVPSHYDTIQAAIDAALDAGAGNTVVISQGHYSSPGDVNLHFKNNKAITVQSTDPNNSAVVASTVIECGGVNRGFYFTNHETKNTIIKGLTIRNGGFIGDTGDPGQVGQDPNPDIPPADGGDAEGGGIYIEDASPTIRNCLLINCQAVGGDGGDPNGTEQGAAAGDAYGGGIYCDSTSNPLIEGCEIISCSAVDGNATDNQTFGTVAGGGIYIEHGSDAVIKDCLFTGCQVSLSKGAPAGHDLDPGWVGGGAIYHGLGAAGNQASITGTTIINNTSHYEGGGIYFKSDPACTVFIGNCEITNNTAQRAGGGGIRGNDGVLQIYDNTIISGNNAVKGGGIQVDSGGGAQPTVNIFNSDVNDNTADFGGGFYLNDVNLVVVNSSINGNTAGEGAGLNGDNCKLSISHSEINNNTASGTQGIGGGMTFYNSSGNIIDCVMKGNSADGSQAMGGAAYFSGYDSSPKTMINCLITDNVAGNEGAGLFCHMGAWVDVNNCTIADNTVTGLDGSGGGITSAEFASYIRLQNSIVFGNDAPYGPQIAVGRKNGSISDPPDFALALVDVSYSDVQGGENEVFIENPDAVAIYFLEGNWDEEKPFVSAGDNGFSYFLRHEDTGQLSDSDLVDAGQGTAAELAAQIGFDLTTRIDGIADSGPVDIGYHYAAGTEFLPDEYYNLTIRVEHDPDYDPDGKLIATGPDFEITAFDEPSSITVFRGVEVSLTAVNEPDFDVFEWQGADNVPHQGQLTNIVTMNSDKEVVVSFTPGGGIYYLMTNVDTDNGRIEYLDSHGRWVDHPGRTIHSEGEIVDINAVPNNPIHVPHWSGTDNDNSISRNNQVTMGSSKLVTVSFIEPRVLYVGQDSQYQVIQHAINDASPGDTVMVSSGTWNIYEAYGEGYPYDHLVLDGKDITITGVNPDEPNSTLIQGGFWITNVTRETIIQGLTITGNYRYADSKNPDSPPAGWDGFPGEPQHGGGMQLHSIEYPGILLPGDTGFISKYWDPTKSNSGSPTVRNCVFLNCSITGSNGADGVAPSEEDYPVWHNGNGGWASWAHGGAVSCGPDSNPLFENCVFQGNVAIGGDAGKGADSSDLEPGKGGSWGDETDNVWDFGPFKPYWKYSGYGGAVYIETGCTAEFIDCNFIDNYVQGGSCGISGTHDGTQRSGWPYQHYRIDRFGGAVYAAEDSAPIFRNCVFRDNYTDPNGKLLHNDGGNTVSAYQNLGYGGAFAFEDGADVTLENCTFEDNLADIGAGVYFTWSDPYIKDCNFYSNSANNGGGILCVGGSGTIESCFFTGNSATIEGGQGGAISCLGANTEIIDTQIISNYSQSSGGGLYISSRDIDGDSVAGWNMATVKNCLIAENIAGSTGAGISSNWHAFTDIDLCTIANNTILEDGYGGGLYSSYGSYVTVADSILWGNTAGNGKQIAVRPAEQPAGVAVLYSNIQGGDLYVQPPSTGGGIWVDQDCLYHPANPAQSTNIGASASDNPLFVSSIMGDYYLSNADTKTTGQTSDSSCVNAGSTSASSIGMDLRTTRTDEVPDRGIVDMGYHYPLGEIMDKCSFCDLDPNGKIDYFDQILFVERWLDANCSEDNDWCGGADFNFDGVVDIRDFAYFANCWLVEDNDPPLPNPMQWEIAPRSISNSTIIMKSVPAYDAWSSEVEYFFKCSDHAHDRDWDTDPNYESGGLTAGTQYAYQVKARDQWGNETEYSVTSGAVVGEDTVAPKPNPMTWAVLPQPASANSIAMSASLATDTSGVEYGFWNLDTGAVIWQDSRDFLDEDLEPLTQYRYRTAARDKSSNQNITAWSVTAFGTTDPNDPNGGTGTDEEPPITGVYADIYKAAFESVPAEVLMGDGYHHQMTAVTATDETEPVLYMFICVSNGDFSSGWQTDTSYDVLVSSYSKSSWIWQVVTMDSSSAHNVGTPSDYWNCKGGSYPYP